MKLILLHTSPVHIETFDRLLRESEQTFEPNIWSMKNCWMLSIPILSSPQLGINAALAALKS